MDSFIYRTLPAIGGGMLATVGAVLAIAGGATFAVFGSDGRVATGNHDLSTQTSALVSDVAEIDGMGDLDNAFGDPKLSLGLDTSGGKDVFVGVGPKADVDRYLAGAQIDRVTDVDLDPYNLDRERRDGNATPARPADQTFWTASASGAETASLKWKVRDGDYRFVVMNADGSRGVSTDGNAGLTVPHLPGIAAATGIAGLLIAAMGVFVLVAVLRDPRDRGPRNPAVPASPGPLSPAAS